MSVTDHPEWPNHLTEEEFREIVEESDKPLEVAMEARMTYEIAKKFIRKLYDDPREHLTGFV